MERENAGANLWEVFVRVLFLVLFCGAAFSCGTTFYVYPGTSGPGLLYCSYKKPSRHSLEKSCTPEDRERETNKIIFFLKKNTRTELELVLLVVDLWLLGRDTEICLRPIRGP